MKILHVVPGLAEQGNGIAVAVKRIAERQRNDGHEVDLVETKGFASFSFQVLSAYAEVWVHSMWTPMVWKACLCVLKCRSAGGGPRLVRMTHANLDPVRYRFHGWKKWLVAPIERWLYGKTDRVVVTCEAECDWCRTWGLKNEFQIVDLKQFFNLRDRCEVPKEGKDRTRPLHVLYLGRRHPLKGVRFLEQAIAEMGSACSLHVVSDHSGAELEADWEWCDVLCLPTLSENFGLVIAEALERGKFVITTDGAPAWADLSPSQGIYLKGYRGGTDLNRVQQLKSALSLIPHPF